MALRTKTVEYAFGTDTVTLAAATRRNFAATTLYIPETGSRTFRSVHVEVSVRGDETAAQSLTSWLIGVRLGAAAFSDATVTVTLTNSGDHQSHVFTRDVTAYFTSNFGAGASQTCEVGLQFGGLITANHTVKLIVTYEYQDSAATTRVKTVRIPLESPLASLTAALANVGTDQIPLLDDFCPESSKVFRNIWLEFTFNDGGNAVTNFSLGVDLTGGTVLAEVAVYRCNQALNTAVYGKAIWDLTGLLNTNATANLRARSNATATRFALLGCVLHVTYEYDHAASTTILNSLMMAAADETGWPGNTTTADKSRFERVLWIEEPGTITMVQSGLLCFINDPGSITLNLLVGSQTGRAYVMTGGSIQSGPYAFSHRIDSGSGGGAMGTLARGRNAFNIDRFATVASAGSNFSAFLFVNYLSDKHADGDGAHSHTTCWSIMHAASPYTLQRAVSAPTNLFNIPEASYFLGGMGFEVLGTMSGIAASGLVLQAERGAAASPNAGWVDFATALIRSDAELGVQRSLGAARDEWQRYPGDLDDTRMAIETTRQYRICSATTMVLGCRAWMTYHSITYTVSGSITGSSGGTVNIEIFRSGSGEKIGATSRVGNGAWSFTWYDNTQNVFATARESAALLGRSDNGLAT